VSKIRLFVYGKVSWEVYLDMNFSKLFKGQIIKNYKELCKLLDENVKGGASKRAQLKELECYSRFHKEGNKFIIDEIYDTPKKKVDGRGDSNKDGKNSKYIDEIKDILVDYIFNNRSEVGKVILSFPQLISVLGLVNNTYNVGNYRKKELADIFKIELHAIYYFYNNTRNEFKNIIERALNILQKRSVIIFNRRLMIAEEIKVDEKTNIIKREATVDETNMILSAQNMTLEYMGLEDLQALFLAGSSKYKEFMELVLKEFPESWKYYYTAYELITGDYAIKSEYNTLQRRRELNDKSIERLTTKLKVVSEDDSEKKLIDALIDEGNYDKSLDEKLIELSNHRRQEKYEKVKETNLKLIQTKKQLRDLEQENFNIKKQYDECDAVDRKTYYSYVYSVKDRKNIYDIFGKDYKSYDNLYEAFEGVL
jgi:hypothetical protein